MPRKASKPSRKLATDVKLLAMIDQHDQMWKEWDRLAKVNEQDPRISALSSESAELEREILATPAFTDEGLTGKRRIVERAELSEWDDLEIIDVILRLDAERIAAR